ncbi:MAG: tetratricopeptide repeat protein [Candidatus Brocadiales bacterium]
MKSLGMCVLVPILASFLLSSCATDTNDHSVSSFYNYRGIDYYEGGRLDDAAQEFKRAVGATPDSAKVHANLGITYYANGEPDKAAKELKKALKVNPGYAEARSALGNIHMDNGDLDDALFQYKEAVRANGNYADAHNNLGNAYWALGWREQAIFKYKDAIALNPNFDIAYVNLGSAYKEEGMLDEAVEELTRAEKLNPYMPEVHYYLAGAYYDKKMLEEAVSEYKKSINLYGPKGPTNRIAMANGQMALAYYEAGEYGMFVSSFKKVLEVEPGMALMFKRKGADAPKDVQPATALEGMISKEKELAESYSSLGEQGKALEQWRNMVVHCLDMLVMPGAHLEGGMLEEARSSFEELFQTDRAGREAQGVYLRIGQAYLKRGNFEKAQIELERALEVNPVLLEARLEMAKALIGTKDLVVAAEEARKAELLYPGNEGAKVLLGGIYLKMDMFGDARVKYNEALALSPRSVNALNNLGVAYVGQGRLDDGITQYLAAIEIDPRLSRTHMNLGRAYYRKGMLDAAGVEFDKALDMNPGLAGTYEGKAMIAESEGKWEEAIGYYERSLGLLGEDKYLQKAEIYDHLASSYSKKFMTEQAISELLSALEMRLSAIKGYDAQGLDYYGSDLYEEAFRCWERSVNLGPVLAKRYDRLGVYYSRAGRYDEAALVYRNAAGMYPQNESKALMHYRIADIMVEDGMLVSAIVEYEKAIELDPRLARAYTGLGVVYDKKGQLEKAVAKHKKALEVDPNLAVAHKNLGMSYHKQGLGREARKEFAIYNNRHKRSRDR